MSSKLDKMFITAQLGHLEQYSSFWARKKGIFPLQMSSKHDKTFRTAKLGHLEHHSSFWARKKMKLFFAPNELKTWLNVQNGSVRPFGTGQLILSEKKMNNVFAQNELKTWQNVQNGSVRPFWASQLILGEKKVFFRSEWAQNLTKCSERLS